MNYVNHGTGCRFRKMEPQFNIYWLLNLHLGISSDEEHLEAMILGGMAKVQYFDFQ